MKNNESLLEGSLYTLDSMIDSTPSCLKVISSEGKLLKMNPTGLSLIEAENFESVDHANVYDIVEESHREKFKEFNEKVCSGHKGRLVFEIVGLKGTRRWMETYAAPYKLPNGEIAHIAITNDITHLVENEKKIQKQKEILAETSRLSALGQFASGVAHEINNPLFIISGKTSRILRKIQKSEGIDPEELIQELNDIKETTKRIEEIVHNLKEVSGTGGNCKNSSHNLFLLVKKIISLTGERLRNHNIEVAIEIPEDLELKCNPVQISQVLMNLINNSYQAISSSEDEKWLIIKGGIVGNEVCLCITDSGKGISEEVQKEMMNPFFTTKEIGEGTGLGLSISSSIMANHGGRLVFDKFSSNTRFVMHFPLDS